MPVPTPHNEAKQGDIAKIVLMPGDPLRARYVAEHYLEHPVCFNTVRNMLGYTGTLRGRRVSVMGHGMGIPSVSLYAWELYSFYGVESIIRIGSAGGLADDVKVRDVIIAMAASTNSHLSESYLFPAQLSASASWPLLRRAAEAADALDIPVRVGQVFSEDAFYSDDRASKEVYRNFGILGLEMEAAGLYWTAQRLHKQALTILTVSDHIFTGESLSSAERQESFHDMMRLSLETAWDFAEE